MSESRERLRADTLRALKCVRVSANIWGMDGDRTGALLVHEIRTNAHLSQAELARRAGMPRSVINAYEHGTRQPRADALARIAAAAGMELRAVPRPHVDFEKAGRILAQVLDLAEALPQRRRGPLAYPVLSWRAA